MIDFFFTLYDVLSINNITKRMFNNQYQAMVDVSTKSSKIHFTVSGDFVPDDIVIQDVSVTINSPAGNLVGHGKTVLEAFNDSIKTIVGT